MSETTERPAFLPHGMPWPPPRPKPIDPDQVLREHNTAHQGSPMEFQIWLERAPRVLHSQHRSLEEAKKELEKLRDEERAQAAKDVRKARKIAGIWCWSTGEEIKP